MAQRTQEADIMRELDAYIFDYLLKRKMVLTAKAFVDELKNIDPVDIYAASTNGNHPKDVPKFIEVVRQQMKTRANQLLQMQQSQPVQQSHALQERSANLSSRNSPITSILSRKTLMKSRNNHPGQLVQGNQGGVSASLQKIQAGGQQTAGSELLGVQERSLSMNPSSSYKQEIIQSKSGFWDAGLSFEAIASIKRSDSLISCHFSSDGRYLASGGMEKKVVLWNIDTMETEISSAEHLKFITDIRFQPNSSLLATSSYDTTVRLRKVVQLWNKVDKLYCRCTYTEHTSQVMSLDFHPKNTDLFCSCDLTGEVRLWNVNRPSSLRISKGGMKVRFHPTNGHLLASTGENMVSILDIEADRKINSLQSNKDIFSVCWDASGDHLASVGLDCVKIWSIASGDCIREIRSSANNFHSCVFHPRYPNVLVIGGRQSVELWDVVENRIVKTVAAHRVTNALAQSPVKGLVASASVDKSVKLWK